MQFLRRLWFALTWAEDLEALIRQEREKREAKEFEENRHRLHLCFKHRQEQNRSHYSPQNCHYCQLEARCTSLQHDLADTQRRASTTT